MKSCIYNCTVMHHRLEPKKHAFQYKIFFFYIDLDEIDLLSKKFWFISRNRFNVFNFRDADHLEFPRENPIKGRSTKENILSYLNLSGLQRPDRSIHSIGLLTNLRTWGHQFNPVSFYFVKDVAEKTICSVVEVGNTFYEQKPYLLDESTRSGDTFELQTPKYFYVSPFINHDALFDFKIGIPGEKLDIRIDDLHPDGKRFFISTVKGERVELSNWTLFKYILRFPFITLKVIFLIHWQALKLLLKGIGYHKKNAHPELQQEVYKPYSS